MFLCEHGCHVVFLKVQKYLRNGQIPFAVEIIENAIKEGPRREDEKRKFWEEMSDRCSSD